MPVLSLIRAIHPIEDAGPVIRFSPEADLDAVLLEALSVIVENDDYNGYAMVEDDEPTIIDGYGMEPRVGWFRMDPCPCGGQEHNWHIRYLGEERPTTKIARGSWFGMWFEW